VQTRAPEVLFSLTPGFSRVIARPEFPQPFQRFPRSSPTSTPLKWGVDETGEVFGGNF